MRGEIFFILVSVILVLSSFVLLHTFSAQNTTFAKNLITTTNLAQEGINEIVHLRDQNSSAIKTEGKLPTCENILDPTISCTDFKLTMCSPDIVCLEKNQAPYTDPSWRIDESQFFRKIRITDDEQGGKNITALVWWNDEKGIHKSVLTRKLTKEDIK